MKEDEMTSLKRLLEEKARPLISARPDDTVVQALELMAQHDIGVVLVMDGEDLVGIFSERDFARKMIPDGPSMNKTLVKEIMSGKVLYVTLSQTVQECMALMTEYRVRHLPVLDENKCVLGILSIGDMVKETISEQAFLIQQLEHYIKS
jgi:CBS domain-containing protein